MSEEAGKLYDRRNKEKVAPSNECVCTNELFLALIGVNKACGIQKSVVIVVSRRGIAVGVAK